ncbi:hypothetical protein ACEQ8H_003197 [Pleosporales sp. CAS-2024a]
MDSGLSSRAQQRTLAHRAAAPPQAYDSATAVDLSSAQNELLRPELLAFLKSIIQDQTASEVFALPASNHGEARLRLALASFFNAYFHPVHSVKSDHVVVTASATDAIESVIQAVCDDGDSVLVPGPSWLADGFTPMLASRANVNIIVAQTPSYNNWDNYLFASLQATYNFSADKKRIKAVLLCNPHNPLSRCYPKKALLEVMEFCQEHGCHLIVDEIYALTDLACRPAKAPAFVSALSLTEPLVPEGAVKVDASRVHVIWSASKLFGLNGLGIGCIISQQNQPLLSALSHLTTNHATALSTTYLAHLLVWPQLPTLLHLNTERLSSSYRLLASALTKWNVPFVAPSHGLFLFARLARHARCAAQEKAFYDGLARAGVRVGQGPLYKGVEGEFGWARICFAVEVSVLQGALARVERVLAAEEGGG